MTNDLFSGPDRVDLAAQLGRPIRQGTPDELKTSDLSRVHQFLGDRDAGQAMMHLGYLRELHRFVIGGGLEWCGNYFNQLSDDAIRARALELFLELARQPGNAGESQLAEAIVDVLRQNSGPAGTEPIIAPVMAQFDAVCASIQSARWDDASSEFTAYIDGVRLRHDLVIRLMGALASTTNKMAGQSRTEALLQSSMGACGFNEFMWQLMLKLSPRERAAVLAEHLRTHFSGLERDCSVEIQEDDAAYKLIMHRCGSGGVLRNSCSAVAEPLAEASPSTWGRAGEVPPYCAHCAQNELASVERLGYPIWVTEFNPDHTKPCCWTIYKRAEEIPASAFERLGLSVP